jgi:uncharacterized protein
MAEDDAMTRVEAIARLVSEHVGRGEQSVAHRMDHLNRVRRNALLIARDHPEADLELLELAALLHDADQPFDDKANHVARSMTRARELLKQVGFPEARSRLVLAIIAEHSSEHVAEVQPASLEAKILFDADKLDGVGAIGILRVFALFEQRRESAAAAVAWYRHKIAVAAAHLQTPSGRALIEAKMALVDAFLKDLEPDLASTEP